MISFTDAWSRKEAGWNRHEQLGKVECSWVLSGAVRIGLAKQQSIHIVMSSFCLAKVGERLGES